MKKISFLFAFLCIALMAWAFDENVPFPADGTYKEQFTWSSIGGITAPMGVNSVESKEGVDVIYVNVGQADFDRETGIIGCEAFTNEGAGVWIKISSLTKKENTILFKNSQGATLRGFTLYNSKGTSDKTDPELRLNVNDTTLNANKNETLQLAPSRLGTGAITYESNKPGIATVSESGLITAVGRGIAIITVRVAAAGDYDSDTKMLTITVTGDINWNGIDWLESELPAYSSTYKVAAGEHVPSIFNIRQPGWDGLKGPGIYAEYPSAVFGDFSHDHYQMGAGILWYLSEFTAQVTEVVVPVNSVDYSFFVYYKDGTTTPTAIDNVEAGEKAIKVFENGQLVIIKNGVKYNALGAELR